MRKSKNRYFYHIFVSAGSAGDAPGAITLNVVWMEREFDAYKLSRCMCPSNYNHFWDTARYWSKIVNFYRAMRCISAVFAHLVSVCLSVTFVDHIKTNKHIFEIFSPSGSDTILVFPCHTSLQYSDGDPHTNGDVEYRWGRRFSANIWLYRVLLTVQLRSAIHSATTKHDKLLRLVAGKRRRLFLTGDDDEVFMTRSQSTLRRREHSSI